MAWQDASQLSLSFNGVTITQLRTVELPSLTAAEEDTTYKGDVVITTRPSKQKEPGSISCNGDYDSQDTTHAGLLTAFTAETLAPLVITLSNADTITISEAYVAEFSLGESGPAGNQTFSVRFKLNALPDVATPTP